VDERVLELGIEKSRAGLLRESVVDGYGQCWIQCNGPLRQHIDLVAVMPWTGLC
jgi:hypothetical protein